MVAKILRDTEHIWKKAAELLFFFIVLGGIFSFVFFGGNAVSSIIENAGRQYLLPAFAWLGREIPLPYAGVLMDGLYSGIVLGLGLVISYVFLFYFAFSLLEESNFTARVSQNANFIFRKIGLSGRAVLPLLMGYGCTVPAVLGARAAKTEKERIAIGFLSLFLPCAARTSVILALIGAFLGPLMALAVYLIDAVIVLLLGGILGKVLGLKAAAPEFFAKPQYKIPNFRLALSKSYYETLEFVQMTIPWIVAGTVAIEILTHTGMLGAIGAFAAPFLEALFGLPEKVFIPLVFGVIRGELTLVMLSVVGKTTDFALLLTPRQMLVFSVISMIYVPCLATIAALIKEFGKREALFIIAMNLLATVAIGVLVNAVLSLFLY